MDDSITNDEMEGDIAVIGMSGRFPGAKNIDEFWQNLKNGVESITFFSEQELIDAGIKPSVLKDANYVKAKGILDNVAEFDATFFGLSPKEAEITDPQQRLFLECAWEALENAGYDPQTYSGAIGIYGGMGGIDTYFSKNLSVNQSITENTDKFQLMIGNDKDFLCTRISYKLNLNGPSITVQTACSTSLVAVVMACKSLLTYECDMVLAGGVSISLPAKSGYLYREGMILSPDGHCRAFDAKAQGIVPGNGAGIVVLKRAEEAIADGDHIYAIIKGTAINNDGTNKVGYTAPSVEGQMQVIAEALDIADIPIETISYIETHGTGTPLGDPIEIAARTKLFRANTDKKAYCPIGSVKTNIGHLDTAAGIAGFIKTVLALKHQLIPPSLHFDTPNPKLDLDNSPFYVNTKLSEWKTSGYPRRAGVSAFGIGGTNAHVVLEEAPVVSEKLKVKSEKSWQLLVLSAKTATALETATRQLVKHLKQHPHLNLADVAYTYQVGRRAFNHRRLLVCQTLAEAINALSTQDEVKPVFSHTIKDNEKPSVVFMFSGQGAQYVNMGLELYQTEPMFREQVDRCAKLLKPHLGLDLRGVLYPKLEIPSPLLESKASALAIDQTAITQPAIFVIEYSLAQLWMAWGIKPKAMIGHSIGEYVAACLAGVFTLEESLMLVAARGQLMQSVPAGTMLAVPLSETEIQPFLNENIDLAAINVPSQSVISGPIDAVERLATQLAEQNIECQRLHTSHAFHSEMMAPILRSFLEQVQKINLKPPKISFISNVTGTWISNSEATDPNYWVKHIRQTVRFADGLKKLIEESDYVLLEIGPGRTLSTFTKRHPDNAGQLALTSLRHPKDEQSDNAFLLNTLGQLWMAGITVDWAKFQANEQRYRLPLPTYPFERQRYWIEPQTQAETVKPQPDLHKKPDMADWFYIPSWKRTASAVYNAKTLTKPSCWLIFLDECGLGSQLVERLRKLGQDVITVTVGEEFTHEAQKYTLNPHNHDDYDALLQELLAQNKRPQRIIHCWMVTPNNETKLGLEFLDQFQNLGFYSLLFLTQALGKHNFTESLQIEVISSHLQAITDDEALCPEKATLLGPCRVIPQEYPNITCQSIDIVLPNELVTWKIDNLIEALLAEFMLQNVSDSVIAYRGQYRWVQTFEAIRLEQQTSEPQQLRNKGVYLITGGLGGIGLVLAEYLAKTVQAKLILTMRSAFPDRKEWQQWLATHNEQDSISHKIKKVQTFETLGAEVLMINADVTNIEQMQNAITQSLARFGHIHGVIHTAGVPGGGIIHRKTWESTENIMAPKVRGIGVLDAILKDIQLDFLVLCSSLTSILGGFGQVDYCAANAFLDAFAHYKNADGLSTVSILWDSWQEVGMAFESTKQHAGTLNIPQAPQSKAISHPLFDQCIVDEKAGTETYITYFKVSKHWILSEHKVMRKPTLPGTAYLEMARAAVENHVKHNGVIEFKEVYLLAPLTITGNEEKEIRTILTKCEQGFEFVILSQANSGRTWQEYAKGQITIPIEAEWPEQYDLKVLEEKCQETEMVFSQNKLKTSAGFIEFGHRWNNLKQIKLGHCQGLALIELPNSLAADLTQYQLHPALLDVATGFTLIKDKQAYLPFSYKKLRMKGSLPAKIYSYITWTEHNHATDTLTLNIKIMDEQGRELVEIEDYTLRKVDAATDKSEKQLPLSEQENFHLEITSPGILDTLTFCSATRNKPSLGEVEIEVSATGLNFKEVLLALGMLPADTPIKFGLECAGKIVALGEDVKTFQVGDEVIAFTQAGFSAYVTTSALSVMPKPNHLTMEEAATIPVAFMTAYYALHYLGRLNQGERILIHAAAGGVGLAAVQIAQMLGAEIFATAGTPEKRAFLHSLGIEQVMDSRTLAFADIIMERTQGKGVNVVLNSLSGEFIPKSLSVLAPFGRFLEIGKRDVYEKKPLNLQNFEKNLSFFVVGVGQESPHFNFLFKELIQHFNTKKLSPLPQKVFPITKVVDAFEYMARAKHIGKIVLSLQDKLALQTLVSRASTAQFKPIYKSTANEALLPTTNVFQRYLKEGLLPIEGIEVFKRILQNNKPQVIVSTLDLPARLEKYTDSTILAVSKESAPKPLAKPATHSRPQLSNAYAAPRNQLEQKMTEVWENFLGIEGIGIHDDFFGLGGDSLMAVQLVAELCKVTQVEISAHSLLEKTTIATLAKSIQPIATKDKQVKSPKLPSSLVKIQAGEPVRQPLFLVHTAGGHVYFYRDLAQSLGIRQPVYGFQAQGIDGKEQPLTKIEEMATHYIKALQIIQPEGPYLIGGSSFGGIVAFEIAQQLRVLGQKIALLFMADTAGPGLLSIKNTEGNADIDDVKIMAYALGLEINSDFLVSSEQFNQLTLEEQARYFFEHSEIANRTYPKEAIAHIRHFIHVIKVNIQAANHYVPTTYQGQILFFRARERDTFMPMNPENYWKNLTDEIIIHEIQGEHVSMNFPPNVEMMAEHLRTYL
ncbi:SDR family NAD(P)-dependent oxidoreductase [Candidatus Parabeggiatoa sp. HSG14]|uniref:SDR family NAD(P)-dependent oxidoreductase n=1 Tax=Candidatus Parabeggiatoa sp. HSG14 TaxID=3055593 RepID=UPI0025A7BE5C|nr:SDR family NAD(P)-dependent oxidoreductase [Thiotrichales bacterium HSG14]